MARVLVLRADADSEIGIGHVMRCLALGQAWVAAGGAALFASAGLPPSLGERLRQAGFETASLSGPPGTSEDARGTAERAGRENADWLVLDGYAFGPEYQRAVRSPGAGTLVIDDNGGAVGYDADLLLNPNLCAATSLYAGREPGTRLLLGPRFALLREELLGSGAPRDRGGAVRRVLVTLGGADPPNLTATVLRGLHEARAEQLEVRVVLGAANVHASSVEAEAGRSRHRVFVERDVRQMGEAMDWADAVIAGAGATVYEAAFLGVPMTLVVLADNQRANADELARRGAASVLGWHGDITVSSAAEQLSDLLRSPERLRESARAAALLVDGRGAARVIRAMGGGAVEVRAATAGDAELLWGWANDPTVREAAVRGEPIPWEGHREWFGRELADPRSFLFIAEEGGVPVGQVRFDVGGDGAEIDISVDRAFRGQSKATLALARATRELGRRGYRGALDAYVKEGNDASRRTFEAAGFTPCGLVRREESVLIRYRA